MKSASFGIAKQTFPGKDRAMDEKLKRLFDYQRFSRNSRLDDMLTQARTQSRSLMSEEEAELIAAAGRPDEQEQAETDMARKRP